jgi:hypothetical protein
LSASDGTASGTSAAFSVQAGGASRLAWVNPNPSNATCLFTCAYTGAGGNGMTFKAGVQLTDDKGNPVAAASSITVTVSASAGSFTGSASVGITAGQSQSSTGGTGGASAGQITFKTESGSWTSDTLSMTSTPTFTGATASFSK